jgi:cytochrome c peroxidase
MPLNRFKDLGRQQISNLSADSLKFKVPTLRNIQLTYPYMHDGSIFSVPQVIDHYTSGININQFGLDSALQRPIRLNKMEKNELVYFLYTLTDTVFTKNKRFAPGGTYIIKH